MTSIPAVSALVLAIVLAGCSPASGGAQTETRGTIFERYIPRLKAKKDTIIAAFTRDPTTISEGLMPGAPPPFVKDNGGSITSSNVAFLSAERVLQGIEPRVELEIHSPLDDAMTWLDLPQIIPRSTFTQEDSDGYEDIAKLAEAALATRYVAIYVFTGYVAPESLSNETFKPGNLEVMAGIIDLDSGNIFASCKGWASNANTIQYETTSRLGIGDYQLLQSKAERQLDAGVREELGKCFAERTGGAFDIGG